MRDFVNEDELLRDFVAPVVPQQDLPASELTAQEIFDTVAKHLAMQGRRSINPDQTCVYRGPKNTRCAVGVLIADDEYEYGMDTAGDVDSLVAADLLPSRLAEHQALLMDLQAAHDRQQPKSNDSLYDERAIPVRLAAVAAGHRLSPAILDTLSFPEVWA